MRFKNIVPALVVIASVNTATAGNDPPIPTDQRQLDFQLFDAAKNGRAKDVLLLLKHGGSIKARDRFGNTPLLLSAVSGSPMTVDILIKAGSMINYQNLGGSTALLRAVKAGNDESAKLLLQAGADINAVNKQSLSPLVMAAYTGNLEIFKILLEILMKLHPMTMICYLIIIIHNYQIDKNAVLFNKYSIFVSSCSDI